MNAMKKFFVFCLLQICLAGCAKAQVTPQNSALHLAQNDKTSYVIALANDALPAEKTAAEQFQKYFQQVTGASISIKPENEVTTGVPQVLIGAGTRVKVLLPDQDWKSLGSDGIVIKTVGNNLILAGGRPRGTLYAVYQFLEDTAGCRWWTPTENTIPHKSTFTIPPQNVVYVPPFSYREHFTTEVRKDPVFATIMRENGHFQTQTAEWGGHYNILGFVHTFSQLLPPEKYFSQHPEWYSDPSNGNKPCTAASKMPAAQVTQLNLSDPQVLDELTKQALIWIKENPQAGYISISENDNHNYCQDAASVKLAEEEGSQAGPMLKFVNQVAERIHQQYPDFKVETLAYHGTQKPPKAIRPAKNVVIRLAPLGADFGHLLNSDWNAQTRANLLEWAKIAPDLFMWNYVTNFRNTVFPHPNWKGIGPDLRFFADNHVQGVFEQGDSYTNGVGDFVQLRTWLIAHLMWNPQLDQQKLTTEFLQGYYGAAAPYLQQYLTLIEQSFLSQKMKLSAYNSDFSFLSADVINQAMGLFDKAADAVKSDKMLSDRVHRERLALDIAMLTRYDILQRDARKAGTKFSRPKDPKAAMVQYIQAAQSFGIRNWNEHNSFASQIPRLENMFGAAALPTFAQGFPPGDVIDIQTSNQDLWPGTPTAIEEDPAASDGKTARILGMTSDWAIQVKLNMYLNASPENWHVYAMVRVDTQDNAPLTGDGLSAGIRDVANRKSVVGIKAPLKDVAGATYQRIDLGAHQLNSDMYIWFAPPKRPEVTKVYVDRIILIREK